MDALRPAPLTRLRPGHWIAIDAVITVVLLFVSGGPADLVDVPRWAAAVIVALAVLPAAARRRWPRTVLALTAAGWAAVAALSFSVGPPLALAFVMYLIPVRQTRTEALRLLAGSLVVTAAGVIAFGLVRHGSYGTGGMRAAAGLGLESSLLIVVAWLIGYAVQQQRCVRGRTAGAGGTAAPVRRLAAARRADSEERLRIAREVHDVVAHSMSLIAVQAGVANYVAAELRTKRSARCRRSRKPAGAHCGRCGRCSACCGPGGTAGLVPRSRAGRPRGRAGRADGRGWRPGGGGGAR